MASILGTTALMLNGKLVVLPVYLVILCEEEEPEVHVSVTTIDRWLFRAAAFNHPSQTRFRVNFSQLMWTGLFWGKSV